MVELHADTTEFRRLAHRLQTLSPQLGKELRLALKDAAKPVGRDVAVAAGSELPRRGGLAYDIAGARPGVTSNSQGVSVRFNVRQKWFLGRIDQGVLRHPVFNRTRSDGKRVFVEQKVRPGAFSRPFALSAPKLRAQVITRMQHLVDTAH